MDLGVRSMNISRILISGIVVWIFGAIYTFLTCGWLFQWVYTIPPIIWLDPAVMMAPSNMILSNIFGIMIGIIFALVYALIYRGIPKKGVQKGMIYGLIVWLVGSFSGMITMPFYMNISTT